MKNNKGIILSTYIYILLVFFILILSTMLMVLNNTKVLSNKIKNNASPSSSKVDEFSIVLIGGDTYISKGSTYVDKGYIAQTTGGSSLSATVTSTVNTSTVGTYTYKYEVTYGVYKKSVTRSVYVVESMYYYGYTGAVQTFTVPTTGYYKVELWGAQGGSMGSGNGAYTSGYIYMIKNSVYYLYVGSAGNNNCLVGAGGGYNGGGNSGTVGCSRGGGGATDIRLIGGTWNDTNGLRSRIMVAAGGGAGENNLGGVGGGLMGGANHAGTYSTQVLGSAFGYATTPAIDASGAGGGYYGGIIPTADGVGAGGGSSFISGYAGVNAISSLNFTTPGNNATHYSGNYFIDGQMIAGANSGNGKAIISYFDQNAPVRMDLNNVRYIKDCVNGNSVNTISAWNEIQAVYQGNNVAYGKSVTSTGTLRTGDVNYGFPKVTDGDVTSVSGNAPLNETGLQCVTVDLGKSYDLDEIGVWHYWVDGRTYYSNVTYTSQDNSNWTAVINAGNVAETSQGKRASAYSKTYYYTGAPQTFTVPTNGYYKIELWGAQGGNAGSYVSNLASKTSGKIYLNKNDNLSVTVGGAGTSNCTVPACAGGYNGGGVGGSDGTANLFQGSGGGATDIRYGGTSLNDRIMVAAGSGGASSYLTYWYGNGGGGGKMFGYDGSYGGGSGSSNYPGLGATQTAGGIAVNCVYGSFGQGGTRASALAGGGGGYYGGGCGWGAGGGGGSSFISGFAGVNAIASVSSTAATNNTIHYSNKYFIDGQMQENANSGNGIAKITYVGPYLPVVNKNLSGVRYIKDCINGSSLNGSNDWVELQAISAGRNVALNKTVVGTIAQNPSYPYSRITDGDLTTLNYAQASAAGYQCVTVDLGQSYSLDEIGVWHYWGDGRAYKSNNTFVSSNNSTWKPVMATYESTTVNGKKVSSSNYRLLNIVSSGSFENTGWSGGAYNSSYKKYGAYSLALTGTTSTPEITTATAAVLPTILDNTHIYYARVEGYQDATAGVRVQIYWPIVEPLFGSLSLGNAGVWNLYSFIAGKASFTIGNYQARFDYDNGNVAGVMYFDGAMLIDLTASFGAGNEPTKDWCDKYIPYFDYTYNLYVPN